MKSCLKCTAGSSHVLFKDSESPSTSTPNSPSQDSVLSDASTDSSSTQEQKRKSVTFTEDGEEEVFYVDDWDRSPAAVVERLTYKDVYELKELHISLPRINLTSKCRKRDPKCAT
ncbi:hypothetical protein BDY19DRAFT_996464 [Irpex rosettiformis]|uniref:Uncharacterized protein n=1 Tax=Irpex rosettiformis TaxID=378272 RepID=A0ACB8TUS7_9APHY|nr:hypothetical protein BDY19DRAFT_996464 [Irpex rosettiformis]